MHYSLSIIVWSFFIDSGVSMIYRGFDHDGPVVTSDESRLHNDLFYKKRRSHPTNKPLDVTFGLVLKSIVDYDAVGEAIVISAYIRQKWKNPVLTWDPKLYGEIKKINVLPAETWVPDIYVYHNVEALFNYNGLLDTLKTNIILSHDGSHYWLAPIVLNIGCGMNVKEFPFDTEKCDLLFGSYTHDKSKLILIPENVDLETYTESSEWVFKSMNHTRYQMLYPGSTAEFADIKYTVILKRKSLYYVIKVLYPTSVLIFLTLLVLIQPITGGERTIYLITILLALCWYITLSCEYLPSSSDGVPLSQLFLALSLLVMFLLSVCLCYTIATHYGDLSGLEMPTYLRKYVLDMLGPYIGYHLERKYPLWRENLIEIRKVERRMNNVGRNSRNSNAFLYKMARKDMINASLGGHVVESVENTLGVYGLGEIMLRLDHVLYKLEIDDDSAWVKREWKMAALILDRLFLYFFSLVLVMTVIYCFGHGLYIHL